MGISDGSSDVCSADMSWIYTRLYTVSVDDCVADNGPKRAFKEGSKIDTRPIYVTPCKHSSVQQLLMRPELDFTYNPQGRTMSLSDNIDAQSAGAMFYRADLHIH